MCADEGTDKRDRLRHPSLISIIESARDVMVFAFLSPSSFLIPTPDSRSPLLSLTVTNKTITIF